jgi:microcystin-dependent protein
MEGYISAMMPMGCNFAPRNWAMCAGQLQPISQNTALFSLIGTIYGGDGRTTFQLPDLRGRAPVGMGHGPGLTMRSQGAKWGAETHTLLQSEMPAHTHSAQLANGQLVNGTIQCQSAAGDQSSPTDHYPAGSITPQGSRSPIDTPYSAASDSTMKAGNVTGDVTGQIQVGNAGGNQSFPIVQPSLALNWCICLFGIFPSRS